MQGNPTFLTGETGLALLATATQAEALAAIGAEQEFEIIENANGTAIRLPGSGVQICHFMDSVATIVSDSLWAGGLYLSAAKTLTFPASFSAIPSCAPAYRYVADPGTAPAGWQMNYFATESTLEAFVVAPAITRSCRLGYIAIGSYTP